MKAIPLSQNKFALVDDDVFDNLSKFTWSALRDKNNYYAGRTVHFGNGKHTTIKMHRQIMGITNPKINVDHKDHDGLNNQRFNLRICSNQKNTWNRKKRRVLSTSPYKGVSKWKERWLARITVNEKVLRLGLFLTEIEAARAYDMAALKHHGEFAYGNFI